MQATPEIEPDPDPVAAQKILHHPYCVNCDWLHTPHADAQQNPVFYTMNQIKTIYGFPNPSTAEITVAVISFGGSLVGTLTNGVLTNGDPQAHWLSLGIPAAQHPRVLLVPVNGARIPTKPDPNDIATVENALDVETLGALCPTSSLTIILYIANPWDDFPVLMTAVMNPTTVNGRTYTPSIISCSWGTSESNYNSAAINAINSTLRIAVSRGITITAATGDNGSSNGTTGTVTDFPSSSPYVLACGGTTLICPNNVYDGSTVETAWTSGGGGISKIFAKPDYQSALPGANRCTPDIVMVADPHTGILITVGGKQQVIGGTSFVSPALAAFAAALNLKQAITPLLYNCPTTNFHDITVGSNGAYKAGEGYDHCTGRGSIIGPAIVASISSSSALPVAPPIAVTSISLSDAPATLVAGTKFQLNATVMPENATNTSVTFTSSNPGIATISQSGLMTTFLAGTVTFTATSSNGITTSASFTVIAIPVTGLQLQGPTAVTVGSTILLATTITPSNASNPIIVFSTNNPTVATVTSIGVVTGKSPGIATIIASIGAISASISITVAAIPVSNVLLMGAAPLTVGKSQQLIATVVPSDATNTGISYATSNAAIATVSPNGLLFGKAVGAATITVTTADSAKKASISVQIIPTAVTGITLSTRSLQIRRSGTATIVARVSPISAPNKTVTWTTSNSNVATVAGGVIRGIRPGISLITATTIEDSISARCTVTVR